MDFKALIASIKAGNIEEATAIAEALEPKFEASITELKEFDGKLTEAVSTRDKAKEKIKTLAGAIGITAEDLTPEKLKELTKANKNGDETHKAEIDNLTKLLEEKDALHKSSLEEKDNLFKDKLIEIEIAKISKTLGVAGGGALANFIDKVKNGATLEDGEIVFKESDGSIKRDGAGRPIGVVQRAEAIKADADNYYLFDPTNTGGGGPKENQTPGAKTWAQMTTSDKVELNRTDPAEYERLKKEHYKQ